MFFDRPESGEHAVLVHLDLASETEREDPREFEELVLSAGGDPAAYIMGVRVAPDPRTFVGSGKLAEIAKAVAEHDAEIVMFNHALSPSQERNLEKELQCRVLDRTGLILDIFAQRARTHEGKLQVELAQLQHMSTRLVRGWTHLERQKGGIGLRGPGETQLETDRRLLRHLPDVQLRQWIAERDSNGSGRVNFADFRRVFMQTSSPTGKSTTEAPTTPAPTTSLRLNIPLKAQQPRVHLAAESHHESSHGTRLGGGQAGQNPEEARAIRRVFESYDYNGDGEISFLDLKKVLTQQGQRSTDDEIHAWIRKRDTSGLGTVSLEDFIAAYRREAL